MLSQLLSLPVTIKRRSDSGQDDDYGNEISGETVEETVGELQQQRALANAEPADLGETSDTKWLLILPAGTDIRTGDAIVADGQLFEMFGDPWPARNPRTGIESHVEATVRRVAGAEDET